MFDLPTADDPVRVVEGDCLDVLRAMPDGCVDAVVTDPPYGIDYQSARRTDRAKWKPKIANDRRPFVWWLHDAGRVLEPGGALLCFCRWDVAEAFRQAIAWAGLTTRAQLVWDRMCHGAGDPAVSPAPQHDLVWYATKGRRTFAGGRPKSVVRAMRLGGNELTHPNEKPVPLMRSLVRDYATAGGVVLDPFAGSGTTGVAALAEGRRTVLIERQPEYVDIIRRRLAPDPTNLFSEA